MFEENYKFIVDSMLGRLAKWIRILGYDTKYLREGTQFDLVRISLSENRIIITRNKRLSKKLTNKVILIHSEKLEEQLNELFLQIKLTDKNMLSLCVECNYPLLEIEKEKIKNIVPQYVYDTNNKFYICQKCNKVFWPGTHVEHMKKIISSVKKNYV
jgi:uncharacterized protein with PIN domain